jgi:ribosome-binding protein aMBF1 (putative translation factor)
MTPQLLREAGEALYGARWQSELARELNVSDRTMRRWAAGEFSIPEAVSAELRGILKAKGMALAAVRRKLPR